VPDVRSQDIGDAGAGYPFVAGELLLARSGTDAVLEEYAQLQQGPIVAHGEVVAFVAAHGFVRQGLGWVDVHLLAAAILTGAGVDARSRAGRRRRAPAGRSPGLRETALFATLYRHT